MDTHKIPFRRLKFSSSPIFKRYWYISACILVLLCATFFRFYNYEKRWGLAYDQAHDVLVARYALAYHKIPLVGPFSSAGPFQTGGEWYWFIMLATALRPQSVITPWVVLTLSYVFFVMGIIYIGRKLNGRGFSLVVGTLAAVSTSQIAQSVNLVNQSPLTITSLLALWSVIKIGETKKVFYCFLLGFFVSLGLTIHLQGTALVMLILISIVVYKLWKLRQLFFLLLGFSIPLLPLFIFDINHDFINSRQILHYYMYDQYKISLDILGRRWLTFVGIFLPAAWGHIIGGNIVAGVAQIICFIGIAIYGTIKKNVSKEFTIINTSFLGTVVLLRYLRTPLFDSYLMFLNSFIILITGYTLYCIWKKNKIFSTALFLLVMIGSLQKDIVEINAGQNIIPPLAYKQANKLIAHYPNKKFTIYDLGYKNADASFPLVFYLDVLGKIDNNGVKIGILQATQSSAFTFPIKKDYSIIELGNLSQEQLDYGQWAFVNPVQIYKSTEDWYSRKK